MTEQTRNITEAVIAKGHEDRMTQLKKIKSQNYVKHIEKHLKRLRTLHLYGSTPEEVKAHKSDAYFSTWFEDVENGDIHAMHSILDHFEPLEIITNMGHNYRSRFSAHSAEIILDFRPGSVIPKNSYQLNNADIAVAPITTEEKTQVIKSYLYSSILRMAKELIMYFPMNKIAFDVNCNDLGMSKERFEVSESQVKSFLNNPDHTDFVQHFEKQVLNG